MKINHFDNIEIKIKPTVVFDGIQYDSNLFVGGGSVRL